MDERLKNGGYYRLSYYMMSFDDLQSETAVAKEHALAVTRDYISQPRLSWWFKFLAV